MSQLITKRRKLEASIDMTPLIDVVFQLLIFLMVSSHFQKPNVQVDLPSGKGKASVVDKKQDKHTLSITAENTLLLNGQKINIDEVEQKIKQEIAKNQVTRLEIRGDTQSHLGSFIDVIEKAKRAGITSLSYHKKAVSSEK